MARSPIAAPSASFLPKLNRASKLVIGRAVPSHTNKPILTLVERKSGFAVLSKVNNKKADLVGCGIEAKLKPLSSLAKTLTVDNGKEFADHHAIDQTLGIQTYIADPYCSWQRGSNEKLTES